MVGSKDYFSVRYVRHSGRQHLKWPSEWLWTNKVHNNDGAVTVFHTELQKNNCRSLVLIACCLYNTFYKWTIKIYILNFIKKQNHLHDAVVLTQNIWPNNKTYQKTSLKGLIYHAVLCRILYKVLSELWKVYTHFLTALKEKFWPKITCNCVMLGFIK